jgi:hypothetical protein
MAFIVAGLLLLNGLLATALTCNAPLLIAARLTRKRLHPLVPRVALAVGFALATAYRLWEMEPGLAYMLRVYLPWIVTLGVAGWFVGGLVVRDRPKATAAR